MFTDVAVELSFACLSNVVLQVKLNRDLGGVHQLSGFWLSLQVLGPIRIVLFNGKTLELSL